MSAPATLGAQSTQQDILSITNELQNHAPAMCTSYPRMTITRAKGSAAAVGLIPRMQSRHLRNQASNSPCRHASKKGHLVQILEPPLAEISSSLWALLCLSSLGEL